MYNKVINLTVFVTIIIFLLCSCRGRTMIFNNDDIKADDRFTQIINAIKGKDSDVIKKIYSLQALSEAVDIEKRIDNMIDAVQGTKISWERTGLSSSTSTKNNKKVIQVRSHYKVITEVDEYYFFVLEFTKDSLNTDNVGVYMLQFSKYADRINLPSWQDSLCAGIYKSVDIFINDTK